MSKVRVRSYQKVGKGTYLTTSSTLGSTIFGLCLLWFFRICFYYPIKYLIYVPTKWCITKIMDFVQTKNQTTTNEVLENSEE